jgi:hypothetical protein
MSFQYENLDDEWINNFERTDQLYQHFYKDDLYYVNLQFIYVNRENDIEKIQKETFLMSIPNLITREEIIGILKNKSIQNEKRYSLLSILKYNIHLESQDVLHYLHSSNDLLEDIFLTSVKNIDQIVFEKSISMFQDLNDVIFTFYEKSTELKKPDPNNITKRVYLNSNTKKKTIRKQYKD